MFDFSLKNNDASELDLSAYLKGNKLLLVFFRGAWCNFCKKQLKEFQDHLAAFKKQGIEIIAISADNRLNSSLLREFLKLEFPVLSDNSFQIINLFGFMSDYKGKAVSVPAILLFNSDGKELYRYISPNFDERLSAIELLRQISAF